MSQFATGFFHIVKRWYGSNYGETNFKLDWLLRSAQLFEALLRKFAIAANGNQFQVTSLNPYNAFYSIVIIIYSSADRNVSSVLLPTHVNVTPRVFY